MNSLQEVLKNFQSNNLVTGKTLFYKMGPFCTPFVLTLASERPVFVSK